MYLFQEESPSVNANEEDDESLGEHVDSQSLRPSTVSCRKNHIKKPYDGETITYALSTIKETDSSTNSRG